MMTNLQEADKIDILHGNFKFITAYEANGIEVDLLHIQIRLKQRITSDHKIAGKLSAGHA